MMKDIKIPRKRIRTELIWLLACFILGFLGHAYNIYRYKSSWAELFTGLHIMVLMALIVYVLLLFIRGLGSLILRFTPRDKDD